MKMDHDRLGPPVCQRPAANAPRKPAPFAGFDETAEWKTILASLLRT